MSEGTNQRTEESELSMNATHSYGPITNDTEHPGATHQLLGGNGVCYWKQLINGMHLDRNLHCVEYVLVPPGASIGMHTHERTEEIYYILRGCATMGINEEQRHVWAGDLITTPIGGRHSLANTSDQPMAFFVVEVYPGSIGSPRQPVHIPLRTQMLAGTSPPRSVETNTISVAALDLSWFLGGNWAEFAVAELPPAGQIGPYTLTGHDEVLFVVEGQADIVFGHDHISGGAGLCLSLPADLPRSVHNTSATEPLQLIWTEVYQVE